MSFAKWKSRSKLYSELAAHIGRLSLESELYRVAAAAYKAGERDGLERGADMAVRGIALSTLLTREKK